jgi:hypothetical protein
LERECGWSTALTEAVYILQLTAFSTQLATIAAGKADILRGGALQILHVRSNHWICLAVEDDKSGV